MEIDVEKIVREYLPDVIHMSLATCKDNKPWVCEVHCAYDEDLNLYFRSKSDRRHSQEIAENPNVAGNIIRAHALGEYPLGVYFEGTAAMLESDDEKLRAFTCLQARFNMPEGILEEAKQPDGHKFYKVTVENWYVFGKLDGEKGQKYKLIWNGGQK